MRRLLFIILVLIAFSFTMNAQALLSTSNSFQYNDSSGDYPVGAHTYTTFFGTFSATSSAACAYPYQTTCNGLRTLVISSNQSFSAFALMTKANTEEVDFILPSIPNNDNDYQIIVQRDNGGGTWIADYSRTGLYLQKNAVEPWITLTTVGSYYDEMLLGALYGYTVDGGGNITGSEYIKSLTDGTANPRTHNGHETFIQIYYSGVYDLSQTIRAEVGGSYLGTGNFDAKYDDGVYVINVRPGSWSSGKVSIKLGWGDSYGFIQYSPYTAYVVFAP